MPSVSQPESASTADHPLTDGAVTPAESVQTAEFADPGRGEVTGVDELELIAARGWPGLELHRLGDWQLRVGAGFTGRANSVLPIGDPGVPLPTAIQQATRFYRDRGLPVQFQVPVETEDRYRQLTDQLHLAGLHRGNLVDVLVGDLPGLLDRSAPTGLELVFTDQPDAAWLSGYLYRGSVLPPEATAVVSAGEGLTFASLREPDGSVVAVARSAVSGGWLGVTAVTVAQSHRRRGLGTAMLGALATRAADHADRVYLQVDSGNEVALAMYRTLGFRRHHGYEFHTEA